MGGVSNDKRGFYFGRVVDAFGAYRGRVACVDCGSGCNERGGRRVNAQDFSDIVNGLTIAKRLQVTPAAVSNWAARRADYPKPLPFAGVSFPLFSWREVEAWAAANRVGRKRNTITTYADGFGVWHARVTLGYPAPCDALDGNSLRGAARRAIRRELEARAPRGGLQGYRLRVEVAQNELGADNRLYSITYKEV
jgi:hypothetical protein